jgi:predicted regulator of Ras-like GTPase activity (Roadblock/LC7/MglB family)
VSSIQETLAELRQASGVKGCALVTSDGLMVAESLDPRFRDDVVVGLASYLMMSTERVLKEAGLAGFEQFTLHATHGKAVFATLGESFLVVLLDQFADLDGCRGEIQGTVQRLRRLSRMGRE